MERIWAILQFLLGFSRLSTKRVRRWIESSFLNSTKSFLHHNFHQMEPIQDRGCRFFHFHFRIATGDKKKCLLWGGGVCCENRFSVSDLNNCGKTTDACSLPCWLVEQRLQLGKVSNWIEIENWHLPDSNVSPGSPGSPGGTDEPMWCKSFLSFLAWKDCKNLKHLKCSRIRYWTFVDWEGEPNKLHPSPFPHLTLPGCLPGAKLFLKDVLLPIRD